MIQRFDVIIIGAGASGLMCAIEAGKRKRRVLIIDHAKRAGQKILISGGGRCNFTNYQISPEYYLSQNPHFVKSALSRYTQWDFISFIEKHNVPYTERSGGQLFCTASSKDILKMLLMESKKGGGSFLLGNEVTALKRLATGEFQVTVKGENYQSESVVIATGGLSYPGAGASSFGYDTARQFGIPITPLTPGLVPFTLSRKDLEKFSPLTGITTEVIIAGGGKTFRENLLFTHQGISGPAALQVSSCWNPGEYLHIDFLPDLDIFSLLKEEQQLHPKRKVLSFLSRYLPRRLSASLVDTALSGKTLIELSHKDFLGLSGSLKGWKIKPKGTEGYSRAEVTRGGVDCRAISSKTMEAVKAPGLFFTGEVLDVTGQLGGYNLQWAWSSGWCAGQYV